MHCQFSFEETFPSNKICETVLARDNEANGFVNTEFLNTHAYIHTYIYTKTHTRTSAGNRVERVGAIFRVSE